MLRATVAIALAIVGILYWIADFALVKSAISGSSPKVNGGFWGASATIVILRFLRSRGYSLNWFKVFTHELTHVFVSFLFFKGIGSFRADEHAGGEVVHEGRGNILISLAPYCLSIYTLVALTILPLLKTNIEVYAAIFVGITYGFHLTTHAEQASYLQPDIQRYGSFLSTVFILVVHAIMFGVILTVLASGWSAIGTYLMAGLREASASWRFLYSTVAGMGRR